MSPENGVVGESRYFVGDQISFRVHIGARLQVHLNPYPWRSPHSESDEEFRQNSAHTCVSVYTFLQFISVSLIFVKHIKIWFLLWGFMKN
ncbi:hypothetical protein Hanom_Chr09g00801871 [Helianthus anomalus]